MEVVSKIKTKKVRKYCVDDVFPGRVFLYIEKYYIKLDTVTFSITGGLGGYKNPQYAYNVLDDCLSVFDGSCIVDGGESFEGKLVVK